jgi:hypothetical protein
VNSPITTSYKQQALEAIICDTQGFATLFYSFREHPNSGMLTIGMMPITSMYVYESHQTLKALIPNIHDKFDAPSELLEQARHRAKLLGDTTQVLDDIGKELSAILGNHHEYFMRPHTGILGSLKRAIQPDLGIFFYEEHAISTTHMLEFGIGIKLDNKQVGYNLGIEQGQFTGSMLHLLGLSNPAPLPATKLPGRLEMRDIKSPKLYQRGILGKLPLEITIGLTVLLVNLNYVRYILPPFLESHIHTRLRIKFVAAYHADKSLRVIQGRLYKDGVLSSDAIEGRNLLGKILGNPESKWLQNQKVLRNLFVHYIVKESFLANIPTEATRQQVIEKLANKTLAEIEALIDEHLYRITHLLEIGFNLEANTFSYGRVRHD